ncbi:hypothetical protein DMN77_07590 [Paenibacillus sp. 79R4]|uniref:DUF5677 domain-containing protein n=1 Tax=Paenibacillus sp. 79R4 TaxID=2212847 RepID=UPI0015C12473|nr:DUF5677 domain-containing protein [Paenibacillus sp. 79R4]NWL87465.1 hypothetical protein [Paenibacillus sp. 79R4]
MGKIKVVRNIENVDLVGLLDTLASTIDSQVDFGTTVIEMIIDNPRDEFIDSTLIVLLRDYLELLDGISVLVRQGCSEAAIPIIRATFEYYLSILYILQEESYKRALSYQVGTLKAKSRELNKTNVKGGGRKFKRTLEKNSYKVTFKGTDNTVKLTALRKLLNSEPFKEVNIEWDRVQRGMTVPPNWYSLYNGPGNIQKLADRLGVVAEYELLYRNWSSKIHGTDSFRNLSNRGLKQIRMPESIQLVCTWAMTWTHKITIELITLYKPTERAAYFIFYLGIRDIYKNVTSRKPLILFKE